MTTPTTPSLLDIFDTFAALHPHPSEASFTLRDHLRAAISTLSAKDAELEALREQGRVDRVAAGAIRDSLEGEVAALRKDVSKWQDDFLALHDQLAAATARADELAAREEREASVCPEDVGFVEYIGRLTAQRDAVLARSIKLEELIIWMSGSSDFSPGGQAHEGWLKAQYLLSTTCDEGTKP